MKKAITNLTAVLLLIATMTWVGGFIQQKYSLQGNHTPYFIWVHIWAILAGIYLNWDRFKEFSSDHVSGRIRINYQYMVVPLAYILLCFGAFGAAEAVRNSGSLPLFAVLAAYNLVSAFSRDRPSIPPNGSQKIEPANKDQDEKYKQVTSRMGEW